MGFCLLAGFSQWEMLFVILERFDMWDDDMVLLFVEKS